MAAGDKDKTEAPTPKKKKDARREGQIAKTNELGAWSQILVATLALQWTVKTSLEGLRQVADDIARLADDPDPTQAMGVLSSGLGLAVRAVMPLALTMVAVGTVAHVTQTGLLFAPKAAKPKWSKVNPLQGLKRLFKPQGLWQGTKSATKVVVLALVSWQPILSITQDLLDSGRAGTLQAAGAVASAAISIARTVAMVGLALAIADYSFQRRQIGKQLRMSKKEIREEHRQAEGDPHVKGQIRRRQQEMSRNRMLAGVADASVVIVNPTHIAVAIRYEPGAGAPKVIAKGRGLIADRIREEAATHFVPIVRDVALARTLEKVCKVGHTIPPDLFEAVARLLAFVMQVGRRASLLGGVLSNPAATPLPMPEPVA